MREHHALGFARGAGGINDRRQVIRFDQVGSVVDKVGFAFLNCAPARFNFSQCEAGCFIRSLFEEDQMLQCRAVREYRANLKKSFLILNHQRAGAGIF